MEIKTPTPDALAALAKRLFDTATAHEQAAKEESMARGRASSALNDMNAAQRDFDACVAQMKKNAPTGSDWRRSETKSVVSGF